MQRDTATQRDGRGLVHLLLADQQRLTAVERFAERHDAGDLAPTSAPYRDLIPLSEPREGEQYSFEVDLDACTGCKACVTACHTMNGLDESEVWRQVGIVLSDEADAPFSQTITTACHHCAEPACLQGCPALAYDKDPVTGIVRHLDDQCIGCQYCVLKCPYDVPKYSASRGIVRKCDMCHGRLSAGEAPACVNACPNEAIRITNVARVDVLARAAEGFFLNAAPAPGYTAPTTVYKTKRDLPAILRAGDAHRVRVEPAHLPLVFMLVLTQAAVGLATMQAALSTFASDSLGTTASLGLAASSALLGVAGIGVATLHLGRPHLAFRAILGVRTSWLSRETLVFGALAPLLMLHPVALWLSSSPVLARALGLGAALAGVAAVACSVMVYVDTRRPFWSAPRTTALFGLSAVVLGASGASVFAGNGARVLAAVVVVALAAKVVVEVRPLLRSDGDLARSARVMRGPLASTTLARLCLAAGIVVVSIAVLVGAVPPLPSVSMTMFVVATLGEILERSLFFRAVAPPRMPGAP